MRGSWLLALALAACAAPSSPSSPSTAPAPATVARSSPTAPPVPALDSAPVDWQLLDAATDGIQGTGTRRAVRELLAGRKPTRTVVVAVIDGGVDLSLIHI